MHAHLILAPATENPVTGERTPLYNNHPHMEAFKEITYRQLDRAFGLDREKEAPEHTVDKEASARVPDREIDFIRFHRDEPTEEAEP